MKKQIIYYVLWDVMLLAYLYGDAQISLVLRNYAARTANSLPAVWVHIPLLMVFGVMILLLVHIRSRFQRTVRSVVAEFLLIGIPAFYMASAMLIPMLLSMSGVENIRLHVPMWMIYGSTAMDVGSILFGYELLLFITGLIQIRKSAKLSETKNADLD